MIQEHQLTKRFGDVQAVAGVDFDVREGELFGFLGPTLKPASICLIISKRHRVTNWPKMFSSPAWNL